MHSCMRVRGTDIPSRKLTTLAMQGVSRMLHVHAAGIPQCLQVVNPAAGATGSEVRLEYHHPAAEPPEAAFVVRIGSIMQVSPHGMHVRGLFTATGAIMPACCMVMRADLRCNMAVVPYG